MVVLDVERSDDIRNPITVQHTCGRNVPGGSGSQIHNPTRLPVFRRPRQDSMRTTEETFVGPDGQSEGSVVYENVLAMRGLKSVISPTIYRIRERLPLPVRPLRKTHSEITAPGISGLRAHT